MYLYIYMYMYIYIYRVNLGLTRIVLPPDEVIGAWKNPIFVVCVHIFFGVRVRVRVNPSSLNLGLTP